VSIKIITGLNRILIVQRIREINGFFIGFVFGLKVNKNNQTGQFSFSPFSTTFRIKRLKTLEVFWSKLIWMTLFGSYLSTRN